MSALVTTAETAASVRPKKSAKGLLLQYLLFKSLGPTKYHFGHLHDSERWQIFATALRSNVDNDKKQHVVNVGAGWGVLTCLARKCMPTSHIVTVERLRPVANAVREFLQDNHHAPDDQDVDQDTLISVVSNMEEDASPCDLVLLDLMSPCLYEPSNTGDLSSGLLATLRSLQHNVKPTTKFIPSAARLFGCLVSIEPKPCVPALSFPLNDDVCGCKIGAFNSFRQPPLGFDAVPMSAVQHERLSDPFVIETINFLSAVNEPAKFQQAVKGVQCTSTGTCNALLVWHELDCGNDWSDLSLVISSNPTKSSSRRQAVILLDGIDVEEIQEGTTLRVLLQRDQEIGHVRYFACIPEESGADATDGGSEESKGSEESFDEDEVDWPRKSSSTVSTVSRWHFSMLLDNDRNSKYQQAIAKACSKLGPDDLVLDIGTGTGLLACFAARAGASRVLGCEANAPIARVAYSIVKRNTLHSKVRVVLKHSTDLVIGGEKNPMDRKASLLVSEILDCGLLGEQVLPVVRHARQHLLQEGATSIPARARVKGMLIDLTAANGIALSRPTFSIGPEEDKLNGITFNKFLRWNTWEQIRLVDISHVALTEPFDMLECDLRGYEELSKERACDVKCIASGVVSAVVMWFDMDLDEDGEYCISTSPTNKSSCWSQAVQLLGGEEEELRSVEMNEILAVRIGMNDDRIKVDLM